MPPLPDDVPDPTTSVSASTASRLAVAGCRRAHFATRSAGRDRPGPDRLVAEESIQVVVQGRGRRIATPGLLLEARQADRLQVARQALAQPSRRDRLVIEHLPDRLRRRLAPERRPAGQQDVQDRSQAVDVRRRT